MVAANMSAFSLYFKLLFSRNQALFMKQGKSIISLYSRVGAATVLILETMWVAALFVDLLCRRGEYTMGLRCWDFMRWSCGRARAPFYACVATALLFANLTLLSTVAGQYFFSFIFFNVKKKVSLLFTFDLLFIA